MRWQESTLTFSKEKNQLGETVQFYFIQSGEASVCKYTITYQHRATFLIVYPPPPRTNIGRLNVLANCTHSLQKKWPLKRSVWYHRIPYSDCLYSSWHGINKSWEIKQNALLTHALWCWDWNNPVCHSPVNQLHTAKYNRQKENTINRNKKFKKCRFSVWSLTHIARSRGKLSNPKDNSDCGLRTAREMKPSRLSQWEESQRQTKFFSMLRVWHKKQQQQLSSQRELQPWPSVHWSRGGGGTPYSL